MTNYQIPIKPNSLKDKLCRKFHNWELEIRNWHSSGSALIITMLVVAGISAAAFGLSRIFLADIRLSASLEDSLLSYYAAEAGIEEGFLRYRVDRNDRELNEASSTGLNGQYRMTTSSLVSGRSSTYVDGDFTFDTIGEFGDGNLDFPNGQVPQDETVEVWTPNTVPVEMRWQWLGGAPGNPECGVEVTDVWSNGGFYKQLIVGNTNQAESVPAGRVAIRVKPLCKDLSWLAFGAENQPIGRTLQTVSSDGSVGRAKRRLQATLNRRSGSIVGIFDFVLGSEADIIKP